MYTLYNFFVQNTCLLLKLHYLYNVKQLNKLSIVTTLENSINTLTYQFNSNGHFIISFINIDGEELKTITTNTMAIDAAFDDCYDDDDREGCYYENRLEAQESLISEILRANEL